MDTTSYRDALAGQGLADRTVAEYAKMIRRLTVYAHALGFDLATIPTHEIRAWADTLPPSWSSRKQARAALRRYYRLVGRDDEPWEAVRVPRKPRGRYRGLTPERARTLRDAALLVGGRRGLAVLILLYTAARAGEAAGMRWDGGRGVVPGPNVKERPTPRRREAGGRGAERPRGGLGDNPTGAGSVVLGGGPSRGEDVDGQRGVAGGEQVGVSAGGVAHELDAAPAGGQRPRGGDRPDEQHTRLAGRLHSR